MSDYELYHFGVKGMKWGVRKKNPYEKKPYAARMTRGHAGPGRYVGGNKRKLAGAKKDLEILDKGGHLSIGLTKKRQEAYDKRDRATLEKKISKLENKISENEYTKERNRQKRHLMTKRVVDVGQAIVNKYLKDHNTTLNGRPLRVSNKAKAVVNTALDYKYMKDTFK